MRRPPQIVWLADSHRLHLQDGPIDLIVEAKGRPNAVKEAYRAAAERFAGLLDALCEELALLRSPVMAHAPVPRGPVARRMHRAAAPLATSSFITPMAAVAGSVADEILSAMLSVDLDKGYVNNGGDIALHLGEGEAFTIGLIDRPDRPSLFGTTRLTAEHGVRGIATSGWRGRSFSLGIADAVTILAATAAAADAAATIVANAVDLPGHPAIQREPASSLQPDSDLDERPVTRGVAPLSRADIETALARGADCAEDLVRSGLIRGAALHLQGETKVVGITAPATMPPLRAPARPLQGIVHA